jgi:hypothetical protein
MAGDTSAARVKIATAQLRQTAWTDPSVNELCDRIEQGLSGYLRSGGGEATEKKRHAMLPEWANCSEPPKQP